MKLWNNYNTTLLREVSYATDGLMILCLQQNRGVKLRYLNVRIKMDKNLFRRGDKLCDKGLDKLSVCAQVERSKYYALPLTLSFFIFL